MIFGHFRYVWGRCYIWYTGDVWYINANNAVFYTLDIIPAVFWYIWCILVHVTFGTPAGTLHQ